MAVLFNIEEAIERDAKRIATEAELYRISQRPSIKKPAGEVVNHRKNPRKAGR